MNWIDELLKKLEKEGITIGDVLNLTPKEISNLLGIDKKLAHAFLEELAKRQIMLKDASILLKSERAVLSTGVKDLDRALRGGLPIGTINLIYGPPGSGKTQISMFLLVRSMLPVEAGGINSHYSVYIDTERALLLDRLITLMRNQGLEESALERVIILEVSNMIQLKEAVKKALKTKGAKFLVVDSLSYPIKGYKELYDLPKRQSDLADLLRYVRAFTDRGGVAVLTAHVVGGEKELKPLGGYVVGHIPHNVLLVSKVRRDIRLIKVVSSPYLPPNEAVFRITERGLEDLHKD